jgi:hypothetical protein
VRSDLKFGRFKVRPHNAHARVLVSKLPPRPTVAKIPARPQQTSASDAAAHCVSAAASHEQHPHWHFRASGGAVHSIRSGQLMTALLGKHKRPNYANRIGVDIQAVVVAGAELRLSIQFSWSEAWQPISS